VKKITRCAIALAVAAVLSSCAGDRAHNAGLRAVDAGDYEQGIRSLEQAVKESPGNTTFRLDLAGQRERALQALIASADRARVAGSFDEAETLYQRVLALEGTNERAARGTELVRRARRHKEMITQATRELDQGRLDEAESRIRAVLAEDPGMAAAVALRLRIDTARGPRTVTPHLRTRDRRPVTLQFRDASTKMVFEVLARETGINFIFDKDVRADGKTTIFVQDVPVEQAIDLVIGQNQLARQVLSENMVMIYPNVAAKQKEYQDQIIRTFYVTNSDPKKTLDMLKTVLNARTLFVDERANAVVMRDTPDMVRMAERMIASVDVPEPEVMLEVEVLEITRSRLQQLGIRYPEGVTLSPTPLAGDPLVLRDLREQDDTTIQVSPISATIDFKKEVGTTNVLASPRIRARNNEEAKILIGQRVPVITNTVTPTATGASVVTGNVQYVDVGLTLEVQPTIHLDSDVGIKVHLEVSSILREINNANSGTLAYQIGTRNAQTVLRLKDGETQILAGLINDQDRRTSNHLPGIGDIPLLGRLFGTRKDDTEKTEIVLSITPHIIRSQTRATSENTEFYYGTESGQRSTPLASSAAPAGASSPVAPPVTAPAGAGGPADTETSPASPAARPALTWDGPGQVSVGQEFDVTLQLAARTELTGVRSTIRYDAAALELTSAMAGDVVPAEARAAGNPAIDARSGRAQLDVPAPGVVTGEGGLVTLHFKALSPRPATMVSVQQFAATTTDGKPVPAIAPRPLVIVVSP
jgi:general secretion pathway protein D